MLTTKEIKQMIENGQENLVPAEDLETYYENMEARDNYSIEGIKNLYNGICHEAVIDYKKARRYIAKHGIGYDKNADRDKAEIEKFFDSDFFKDVSGCREPEKTIKAIEENMKKDAMLGIIR